MRIDVHQHLWTEPLIDALAARDELPYIRVQQGLTVLHLAGERPYVIDTRAETRERAAELVEQDGLDRTLICLSSPLGIEWLPREQAHPLLDAYHAGALALGEPFGAWGAIALEDPDPDDVDGLLQAGCVGLSLPAGALASVSRLVRLGPVLSRLEDLGAPLLVHPGPGGPTGCAEGSLVDPVWWPALTEYVAEMVASWHAFIAAGRSRHPELRIIFTMLAGLAPLQAERLGARGGPAGACADGLLFYESSSYGRDTLELIGRVVPAGQILYGSDRPVVDPRVLTPPLPLDWDGFEQASARALAGTPLVPAQLA